MQKAVFIDRDGTINSDEGHYYIFSPLDFILNPGVGEGLKLLHDAGYLLIVITNQGGIAKGKYDFKDVESVHDEMNRQLSKFGVKLSAIYYCPHHSDVQKCLCRKPGNLNIEKAIARFQIDRNQSFMVGDSSRDVEAGKKSGLKTIKIQKNSNFLPIAQSIVSSAL
jgi:D-glycero-D-manno-heptose 1,7-bisphosphate phosphatase